MCSCPLTFAIEVLPVCTDIVCRAVSIHGRALEIGLVETEAGGQELLGNRLGGGESHTTQTGTVVHSRCPKSLAGMVCNGSKREIARGLPQLEAEGLVLRQVNTPQDGPGGL